MPKQYVLYNLRPVKRCLKLVFFSGAGYGSSFSNVQESRTVATVSQNLPQICTASAQANMKHALKQMQYRFAVIYETPSIEQVGRQGIVVDRQHCTVHGLTSIKDIERVRWLSRENNSLCGYPIYFSLVSSVRIF